MRRWGNLGCDRIWENLGGLAAYEQKMRKVSSEAERVLSLTGTRSGYCMGNGY